MLGLPCANFKIMMVFSIYHAVSCKGDKMSGQYILKNKKIVKCDNLAVWAKYLEKADRKVARDSIGGVDISTVFLGLDHQFGDGPPLLFETLVFGGPLDGEMSRYPSWDDALAGHKLMIKLIEENAAKKCIWKEEEGYWTTCKHDFVINNEGTPKENEMKFCCYCGREIETELAETSE